MHYQTAVTTINSIAVLRQSSCYDHLWCKLAYSFAFATMAIVFGHSLINVKSFILLKDVREYVRSYSLSY